MESQISDLCNNNFPRLAQTMAAVNTLLLSCRVPGLKHIHNHTDKFKNTEIGVYI